MSRLTSLQRATSLRDLAVLLGIPPSAVAFTLYRLAPNAKYKTFEIPKKSGGLREIAAPVARLKVLQSALADLLCECRLEIEAKYPGRKIVSHGFRKEASALTNASIHRNRAYVFNIDIKDFFPSINRGRVRGFLIKSRDFGLAPRVATIIAQIACYDDGLPQGSPCSPIVSDLLAHLLDVRMLALVKRQKCTYSRYADDLTISTNQKTFPVQIAYRPDDKDALWIPGDELLDCINRAGFSLNHKKTRMQYRASRQVVTGLTVNEKVNIQASHYRSARAMCGALFSTGTYYRPNSHPVTFGPPPKGTIEQLEGILNHIHFVKRSELERAKSSQPLSIELEKRDAKLARRDLRREIVPRHGAALLYERLLFYKRFVANKKPLLVAEGKTDNIYLPPAIKRNPAFAGTLFEHRGAERHCTLQFFKYSRITHDLMELGGSSSYFKSFIRRYEKALEIYKRALLHQPVILLIDNDTGADGVFKVLHNLHVTISPTTTAPFYPVTRNLYVIKTPEPPAGGPSCIEDLFDAATRAIKVEGKTFNKSNKIDPLTEYGKTAFAERVVRPNVDKIDFSGFAPLLNRIVSVLHHHRARVASGTPI